MHEYANRHVQLYMYSRNYPLLRSSKTAMIHTRRRGSSGEGSSNQLTENGHYVRGHNNYYGIVLYCIFVYSQTWVRRRPHLQLSLLKAVAYAFASYGDDLSTVHKIFRHTVLSYIHSERSMIYCVAVFASLQKCYWL